MVQSSSAYTGCASYIHCIRLGKAHVNAPIASFILTLGPDLAHFSLQTGDGLPFPIDREVTDIQAIISLSLPTCINSNWSYEVDLVLCLRTDQCVRINVAAVKQVLSRQELFGCQRAVNRLQHLFIRHCSRCGFDIRDQVRSVIITGFSDVGLVPEPLSLALLAVASLWVVRRLDTLLAWREVVGISPLNLTIVQQILLDPGLSQQFDCLITSKCR